jgi:hypothetical protein
VAARAKVTVNAVAADYAKTLKYLTFLPFKWPRALLKAGKSPPPGEESAWTTPGLDLDNPS